MDLLLIIFLTLLNAWFALSEMALSASRRVRLLALQESGDAGAAAALRLMEQPTRFLSSIQIGITSIGLINGIVSEAAFSHDLASTLTHWGMPTQWAQVLATTVVVIIITCSTIVFGELVPKRIAQSNPETVARWVAPAMEKLAWLTRPAVAFLSMLTGVTLRLLKINTSQDSTVTEEEIRASLSEGVDAGVIVRQEQRMVRNVFHLDDRPLSSLMVPRSDIVWLHQNQTVAQALIEMRQWPSHSWYPVCGSGLDEVLGLVSVTRLVQQTDESVLLSALAQPVSFIPETLSGLDLIEQFRLPKAQGQKNSVAHLVLVVDEYGVVEGLMTPRDLLEAITGEWVGHSAVDTAWASRNPDGSWFLDGTMPIIEFKHQLGIEQALPDEDKDRYNTVAGLFLLISGKIPQRGDSVECVGWRLQVAEMIGHRIGRLRAYPVPSAPAK